MAQRVRVECINKSDGKKRQLGDHETHNVKEGDRYETLVRGGVS